MSIALIVEVHMLEMLCIYYTTFFTTDATTLHSLLQTLVHYILYCRRYYTTTLLNYIFSTARRCSILVHTAPASSRHTFSKRVLMCSYVLEVSLLSDCIQYMSRSTAFIVNVLRTIKSVLQDMY